MFRRILNYVLAIIFVMTTTGFAQEKVHWDAVQKIRNEGFKNSKVMEFVRNMTDVYGPRLTGSPYLREAQNWAKDELKDLGLKNAKVDKWGEFGMGWTNDYTSVHMMTPRYSPLIGTPKAWTKSTNGKITTDVMIAVITTKSDLDKFRGQDMCQLVLNLMHKEKQKKLLKKNLWQLLRQIVREDQDVLVQMLIEYLLPSLDSFG
jgi:hypothetical protein